MPHFKPWWRALWCGCSMVVVGGFAVLQAAQPVAPREERPAVPATESIPRPTFPADAPTVRVEAPKPPPQKPLSDLSIDINPVGQAPANAAAQDRYLAPSEVETSERGFNETFYFWQASNMVHQPLYFEQAYVERYGYTYRCLQPIVSGVQFCGDVALLPAKMVVRHPRDCVWTLGYGRPGSQGVPCPK